LLARRFVTGILGAPVGLKGFIRLHSLSGEEGHLKRPGGLALRSGEREWVLEAEEFAGSGPSLRVRFRGIGSPEAARGLTGAEILVDREHAAALAPGEYYVEDLKGLAVTGPGGETLGRVTDLIEGGGGQLLEMQLPGGELRLVPFRSEFWGEVDIEAGRVALIAPWVLA
jgi:16S rRNA processing protein RimM